MNNLYEINKEFLSIMQEIDEFADENDGEVSPELLKKLEDIEGSLETKIERYCQVIANFKPEIEGLKGEEKRLSTKRKYVEKNIDRMKLRIQGALELANLKKIKAGTFNVTVADNPPRTVIDGTKLNEEDVVVTLTMPLEMVPLTLKPTVTPEMYQPRPGLVDSVKDVYKSVKSELEAAVKSGSPDQCSDLRERVLSIQSGKEFPGISLECGKSLRIR